MQQEDNAKMGVILLAGGKGSRFSSTTLKQFIPFEGKPLALHAFDVFFNSPLVSEIVIVCEKEYQSIFPQNEHITFAKPGSLRQHSVFSGFMQLSPSVDWICVHDAVRPCLTQKMLNQLYQEGKQFGAATFASPIHYTIKKLSPQQLVSETLDRSSLCIIHTPQFLNRQVFEVGMEKTLKENIIITDDVSLAELVQHPVKVIFSSDPNIKITIPSDLKLVKALYNNDQNKI